MRFIVATEHPTPPPANRLLDLALSAARGDDAAFEQLHNRLNGALVRYFAQRIGDGRSAVAAEDLAQAAWVDVWRALRAGVYDPSRAAVTTFIFAVAYKTLLRHRRKDSREADVLGSYAQFSDSASPHSDSDLEELLDTASRVQIIRDFVFSDHASPLNPDERTLLLAISRGDSERTLAANLGIAASTLHMRRVALFRKIRNMLRVRGTNPG